MCNVHLARAPKLFCNIISRVCAARSKILNLALNQHLGYYPVKEQINIFFFFLSQDLSSSSKGKEGIFGMWASLFVSWFAHRQFWGKKTSLSRWSSEKLLSFWKHFNSGRWTLTGIESSLTSSFKCTAGGSPREVKNFPKKIVLNYFWLDIRIFMPAPIFNATTLPFKN